MMFISLCFNLTNIAVIYDAGKYTDVHFNNVLNKLISWNYILNIGVLTVNSIFTADTQILYLSCNIICQKKKKIIIKKIG